MAALKWSLVALTALLCSATSSAHRATPISVEPAPFRSGPTPAAGPGLVPSPTQKPISPAPASQAPPRQPSEFDGHIPAPARVPTPAPAPGIPVPTPAPAPVPSPARGPIPSTPAAGPPSSPVRPPKSSPARSLTPATGPIPAPSMESVARPTAPATFPPMKNDTDESKIAVNCCGAGWGSPGCGGMSCPGGGGASCGAAPCPQVPKNPYYCQPAGCSGNPGYGCASGGGFTIYMGDRFPSATSIQTSYPTTTLTDSSSSD